MHQKNTFLGILFVICAVSGIVFETVLYRLFDQINLGVILFERGLFGLIVTILASLLFCKKEQMCQVKDFFNVSNKKLYVARSALMVLSSIAMFYASTLLSTVQVNAYLITTPLFIAPLAVLFLKEKLKISTIIGMLIGFGGIYTLTQGDYVLTSILGISAALVCAISEAGIGIVLKKMSNHDEPLLRVVFWSFMATTLCGIILMLIDMNGAQAFFEKQTNVNTGLLAGLALLHIWQLFFFYKGYQKTDISKAEYGSFAMLPLSASLGAFVFKDAIPPSFIMAITLLITGLLIVMLYGHEQHKGTELDE